MHRRINNLRLMGAEGGSQMASESSPHGLLSPSPALRMYLGAGGCKLCPRRHNQPLQSLAWIFAASMFACRLTETGYTVPEKCLLLIPTQAIPGRQLRLGISTAGGLSSYHVGEAKTRARFWKNGCCQSVHLTDSSRIQGVGPRECRCRKHHLLHGRSEWSLVTRSLHNLSQIPGCFPRAGCIHEP